MGRGKPGLQGPEALGVRVTQREERLQVAARFRTRVVGQGMEWVSEEEDGSGFKHLDLEGPRHLGGRRCPGGSWVLSHGAQQSSLGWRS